RCPAWRCKGRCPGGVEPCREYPWILCFSGSRRRRLALHREVTARPRNAVLIRTAIDTHGRGEISMRRRGWRLPFQRGRAPRIVRIDFLSREQAVEEVVEEWYLGQQE